MSHQNEINRWIKPRRHQGLQRVFFLTARLLPATKSSRDELQYFYRGDVSVYMFACLKLDYLIARDVCDHIIAELRRERLYLALISYGLFYQRIFVFDMTYFM